MIGTEENGWRCIGFNPASGVSTWWTPDPDDPEGILVQERQDVSALLDENKAQLNIASNNWKGDGLHSVARIPSAMAMDDRSLIGGALKEGDDKVVTRLLNDSDYSKLRTKEGTL